jgi:hypothetical protein
MATMKNTTQLTEAEVRALRDQVYGQISTDNNWNASKEKWMTPENIKWLQQRAKK